MRANDSYRMKLAIMRINGRADYILSVFEEPEYVEIETLKGEKKLTFLVYDDGTVARKGVLC